MNDFSESIDGASISLPGTNDTLFQHNANSTKLETNDILQYVQIFFVFGFFWTYNFVIAIGQCSVAGAVASWYFTRSPKPKYACTILTPKSRFMPMAIFTSFLRVFFFHLGSVALGSLVLALIQLVRYILMKIQVKMAKLKKSKVIQILCCCLQVRIHLDILTPI